MAKANFLSELEDVCNAFDYHPKGKQDPVLRWTKVQLQRIIYGAPGTGKSWSIEEVVKQCPDNVFRTTFHPDSDYSTFVGAYKPTMELVKRTYVNEGVEKDVVDSSGNPTFEKKIIYTFVEQAFTKAYVKAWTAWAAAGGKGVSDDDYPVKKTTGSEGVMLAAVQAMIQEHGGQPGFVVSFGEVENKIVEINEDYARGGIVPSDYCYNRTNAGTDFSRPALFVYLGNNQYRCDGPNGTYTGPIMARSRGTHQDIQVGQCTDGKRVLTGRAPELIYLVIEEINRGNCAQVFGDIFQLLDRENGYSKYAIKADEDLRKHLEEAFKDVDFGDAYPKVKSGEELVLPSNLCIWATMNTSDQSLFPMDSAFKRRWDWEYVPIVEGVDKDGGKLDWTIEFEVTKTTSSGTTTQKHAYDWWGFLKNINAKIFELTDSEDKQLGYFFVKAEGGKITGKRFVEKVVFYLWNDVFKDFGIENIFKLEASKASGEDDESKGVPYRSFFTEDGKDINPDVLLKFFEAIGLAPKSVATETTPQAAEDGSETNSVAETATEASSTPESADPAAEDA